MATERVTITVPGEVLDKVQKYVGLDKEFSSQSHLFSRAAYLLLENVEARQKTLLLD